MTDPRIAALAEACATALVVDDAAQAMNREEGFGAFDPAYRAEAFAAAILAALPPDWCGHGTPPEGTRLVVVSIGALPGEGPNSQWGTRTHDGRLLTAEWGEADEHGWYTPVFTAHKPAEIARLRKALESIAANTCCDGCGEAARWARAALEAEG